MVVLLVFREAASTRRTFRMPTCGDAVKGSAVGGDMASSQQPSPDVGYSDKPTFADLWASPFADP